MARVRASSPNKNIFLAKFSYPAAAFLVLAAGFYFSAPLRAEAAPVYTIAIGTSTIGIGPTLFITGTASSTDFAGNLSQYHTHVKVEWGDSTISVTSTTNFVLTATRSFAGSWSNSHKYALPGIYTVKAKLYHQNVPGNESGDAPPASVTIVIPAQCADGLDNDGDGLFDMSDPGCASSIDNSENIRPVITLVGSNPMSVTQNSAFADPGATATDSEDGNLTGSIIASGAVNTAVIGTYTRTYNVTDSQGAPAITVTRTVNVVASAPENTLPLCSDTADNDGDGLADLADPDCASFKPKLTVIKTVVNNNGGTATASSFTMQVTGTNVSQTSFSGNASGTLVTMDPGPYSADESAFTGYAKTLGANCSGTMAIGDNKTCTVTNDDIQPKLTVTKVVLNNNGGTKLVSDFPLFVGATSVSSGAEQGFNAGTYTVSETSQTGYAGTVSGNCASDGSITLQVGDVKSCTITNDDIQPTLVVVKTVVNDNGGTAVASNFTLAVTGSSTNPSSFSGNASGTSVALNAGSYSVSETGGPSGYGTTSSSDCAGTLAPGETKTCTITNDDIQPTLIVVKHVINDSGKIKTASDFSITVTGQNPNPANFAGGESGTTVALDAGSYGVDEAADADYTKSLSSDCTGTIGVGQSKTCTITNDDITTTPPGQENTLQLCSDATDNDGDSLVDLADTDCSAFIPRVTVIKTVIIDNGGTATAGDFTINVTGTNVSTPSFAGSPSGTTVTLDPGPYSVDETTVTGYAKTLSADCSGTLAIGDSKTCTVTNDDIQPKLTVTKVVINNSSGTKQVSDFPLFVDLASVTSGAEQGFNAGTYTVSETSQTGYASAISGDCDLLGVITLDPGDVKSCTITNDDIAVTPPTPEDTLSLCSDTTDNDGDSLADLADPGCSAFIPKLTVIKTVVNNDGKTSVASDFAIQVTGTNVSQSAFSGNASGTAVTLDPGAYSAGETPSADYAGSFSADCSGTMAIGDVKSCTITNDDIATSTGGGNSAPVFSGPASAGGTVNTTIQFTVTVLDPDGDPFTITTDLPSGAAYSTSTGVFSWVPGSTGTFTATFFAFDGTATSTHQVAITVSPATVVVTPPGGGGTSDSTPPVRSNGLPSGALSLGTTNATLSLATDESATCKYSTTPNPSLTTAYNSMPFTFGATGGTTHSSALTGLQDGVTYNYYVRCQDNSGNNNIDDYAISFSVSSGGSGGGPGGGSGTVLGTSTTSGTSQPQGQVLGESIACGAHLGSYIKYGGKNNSEDVKKLQEFLNEREGANLPVTGFYGPLTHQAVKNYQLKYSDQILAPWVPFGLANAKTPTGYVYKTTKRWLNNTKCPALNLPLPQLP